MVELQIVYSHDGSETSTEHSTTSSEHNMLLLSSSSPNEKTSKHHHHHHHKSSKKKDGIEEGQPRRILWSDIQIDSLVASGKFSKVYKVQVMNQEKKNHHKKKHHKKRIQYYALKCLDGRTFPEEDCFYEAIEDLACEADVLSHLSHHENVITLHGITASSGKDLYGSGFFLLMDLLSETLKDQFHTWRNTLCWYGGSRRLASRSSVTSTNAIAARIETIGLGIAKGMYHLHQHNIIHRNLQPITIGFDTTTTASSRRKSKQNGQQQQRQPKIFGFKLAHSHGGSGGGTSPAGKGEDNKSPLHHREDPYSLVGMDPINTRYMAPEAIDDPNLVNMSCDVYSFGLLLFELITLQKPYHFQRNLIPMIPPMKRDQNTKHWRPSLEHVTSPRLKRLILECWAVNPKSRPTFQRIVKGLEMEVSGYQRSQHSTSNCDDKMKSTNGTTTTLPRPSHQSRLPVVVLPLEQPAAHSPRRGRRPNNNAQTA